MSEETRSQPNAEQPERRRRSRSSSSGHRRSSRGHRRRSSSKSSSTKNKFTLAQALLLVWSAATLGTLLYLINDVHRAPLPAVAGLAAAAVVGLLFFFRGLRKKKKK